MERDHVDLHMVIPLKHAVSRVVETLKSVTSRQLQEKFPHVLSKVYWDGGGVWARGLFASTVGINEATIRHYVQHQGEQETGHAQLEWQGAPAWKGGVLHQDAGKVRQRCSRITQRLNVPKCAPRLFACCGLSGRTFRASC